MALWSDLRPTTCSWTNNLQRGATVSLDSGDGSSGSGEAPWGGPLTAAYDINSSGQVTGHCWDTGLNQYAVIWSPTNDLTVIPNSVGWAGRWITDAGWVVCVAGANYLLYHGGQTYDLLTLLDDDGTHWTNIVITDVNNRGQMTGYATNDNTSSGARRAFLLTPGTTVPTAVALIDAEATAERVTLRCTAPHIDLEATLESPRRSVECHSGQRSRDGRA